MKRIKGTIGGMAVDLTIEDVVEPQQQKLFTPPPTQGEFVPASEPQTKMLKDLGMWKEGMSKDEAGKLIGEYYAEKKRQAEIRQQLNEKDSEPSFNHETNTAFIPHFTTNPEPFPWEVKDSRVTRKRGRPRKR